MASVFYLADDVTRRGWRLRHHSFNDILAHWEANRCCTVMLWASLSNSCVNIRILDAGDTRRLWRFRYHFFRLLAEVHIWLHRPTVTKPDQLGPSNFLGRWSRMSPNDPTRSNLWAHASSKLTKKTQPGFKAKPPSNHSHFWPKKWFLMSFLAITKLRQWDRA